MNGTGVECRYEINKYWLVGVRYCNVAFRTLMFVVLGEITETIMGIPFAVD